MEKQIGIYYISVEHEKDCKGEYDKELFQSDKPILERAINTALKHNIRPNIGDMLYGDDDVYFVVKICFYEKHIVFWVDDENGYQEFIRQLRLF